MQWFSLYKRGWHGLNLDPSPDGLAALMRYRPRDVNLPIAVASVEKEVGYNLAGSFAGIID